MYLMEYKSQIYVCVKNPLLASNVYYEYLHHYSFTNGVKQP